MPPGSRGASRRGPRDSNPAESRARLGLVQYAFARATKESPAKSGVIESSHNGEAARRRRPGVPESLCVVKDRMIKTEPGSVLSIGNSEIDVGI